MEKQRISSGDTLANDNPFGFIDEINFNVVVIVNDVPCCGYHHCTEGQQ